MKKQFIAFMLLGTISFSTLPFQVFASEVNKTETTSDNKKSDNKSDKTKEKKSSIDFKKELPKLINPNKNSIKAKKYNAETMKKINSLIEDMEKLEKDNKDSKVDDYLELFKRLFEIHNGLSKEEADLFESNDQLNYIFYKLNYLSFTKFYEDEENFNKLYMELSDIAYLYTVNAYNKAPNNIVMHFLFKYIYDLTDENLNYFKDKKTNAVIQIAYSNINFLGTGANGRDNDIDDSSDDFKYVKPSESYNPNQPSIKKDFTKDDIDKTLPKAPDVENYNSQNENSASSTLTYVETTYVNKNNVCYLVEATKDLDDNVLKSTSSVVDDGFYCGIIKEEDFSNVLWNNDSQVFEGEKAFEVWNSLAENELNELSNLTLHFSLNKDDEKAYYYDSGIRVSIDGKATYTQVRDVLNQIAIKSNNYLVEDENKLLFVAEGLPLVLEKRDTEYSKEEILSLLDKFKKIGMKISDREEEATSIENNTVNMNDIKYVLIDGKKIELSSSPKIEGSIIKLPVEEISKALGYEYSVTDNIATLSKDSSIIKIEIGSKNITVNDNKKITTTEASYVDNILFAEMNLVALENDLKIELNKENSLIEFKDK